ncbi:MAG: 16S rRNA (guanine(966)-N(2))-methyltransferase RsmD [Burkholderiaceae bacterium]
MKPKRRRSVAPGPNSKNQTKNQTKNQVRIVGGVLRRTVLAVVPADGLRPTPDRVRETVFNWLGSRVQNAACLDLFAGTGALGLEAASRGAATVLLNDRDPSVSGASRLVVDKLRASTDDSARRCGEAIQVLSQDALALLRSAAVRREQFDLVFLDPPFGRDWLVRVLPVVGAVLRPGGLLYVESDQAFDPGQAPATTWMVWRNGQAGQVHYYLLEQTSQPINQPADSPAD